jgi:hypothetical protein
MRAVSMPLISFLTHAYAYALVGETNIIRDFGERMTQGNHAY